MKNYLFLLLIFLTSLLSCEKVMPKQIKKPNFVRIWHDTVQGMPFRAKLSIYENKTFEYWSGGCQSSSESNGIWTIEKDTIILNSIKPKNCLYQHPFGIICNFDKIVESNKTIPDCEPTGIESNYEIFDSDKFYIRNDTLIHVNEKDVTCTELKIAFSTKEKIRRHISK